MGKTVKPAPRINIVGASGTGKSTLAKALSERLGVPLFESDDYYHLPSDPPYSKQRPLKDRLRLIKRDLGGCPSWVLSGCVAGWGGDPGISYSLVVFLYVPPQLRLERLLQREQARFGARILPGGNMNRTHSEFMEWTAGYDSGAAGGGNTLPAHRAFLEGLDCPVLRLETPMTPEEKLAAVLAAL